MRTEAELNRMMRDMCDTVGFKYHSIHYVGGTFPNVKVNLEDLSRGEVLSEGVELIAALSAFFFSIYMYTLNLNNSDITFELNNTLIEYWGNWSIKPFPYIGFYAIPEYNLQLNFLLAIPEEVYGIKKPQTVSYIRTHMRQRIVHEQNPSGIYTDVKNCVLEFSAMATALLLEMGDVEETKRHLHD